MSAVPALRPLREVVEAYEAAGRAGAAPELKRLRETADEFGAILYRMLLKQMRATVEKSGLLDGGRGEEIFRDFLDDEYARSAGRQGGGPVPLALFEQGLQAYEDSVRSGRPMNVPTLPASSFEF